MASIRFGATTGADINLPFNGNISVDDMVIDIANDNLSIGFNTPIVDANTRHYFAMDDSVTRNDGVSGVALAYEHASQELITVNPWQNAGHVKFNQFTRGNVTDNYSYSGDGMTIEAWVLLVNGTAERTLLHNSSSPYNSTFLRFDYIGVPGFIACGLAGGLLFATGITAGWHHIAACTDVNGRRLFVDGEVVSTTTGPSPGETSGTIRVGRNATNGTRFLNTNFDSLAIHTTSRYPEAFWAGRYHQFGTATMNYNLVGYKPTSISWSTTTDSTYGQVYQVYVYDVTMGWTQVGGDNPTSPIPITGLTIGSSSPIKVIMSPSTDTLHEKTPILDWIQMDYSTIANRIVMLSYF